MKVRFTYNFAYKSTNVGKVELIADFTGWLSLPMTRDDWGNYQIVVDLPEGTYEYKFIVDGNYILDPCNSQTIPCPFGYNSLIHVEAFNSTQQMNDQLTTTTGIQMQDFQHQLTRLCPSLKEDAEIMQSLLLHLEEPNFIVANAGPMNPGKSTLFNALLGKREIFKTSDARQTTENQEEKYTDSVVLLDTPGCNSSKLEDDKVAGAAFRRADLILFVHNISTGGIQNAEKNILQYLKKILGNEFTQRVLFICNRIDEAISDDGEDDSTIVRNVKEIEEQCVALFGKKLQIIKVSPIYYLIGLEKRKSGEAELAKKLLEESGIPLLKKILKDKINTLGRRGTATLQTLVEKLKSQASAINASCDETKKQIASKKSHARTAWKATLDNIRPAWQECVDTVDD